MHRSSGKATTHRAESSRSRKVASDDAGRRQIVTLGGAIHRREHLKPLVHLALMLAAHLLKGFSQRSLWVDVKSALCQPRTSLDQP